MTLRVRFFGRFPFAPLRASAQNDTSVGFFRGLVYSLVAFLRPKDVIELAEFLRAQEVGSTQEPD